MQFDIEEVITGGSEIVSLQTAKDHLRVTYTDEDTMITRMIKTARAYAEQYTQRALIAKTLTVQFYDLDGELRFELPFGPVATITSVERIASDGTATALVDGTNYYAQGLSRKILKLNKFYSSGAFGNEYQLKTVYTVTADTRDQEVFEDAILKAVGDMYRNRENTESENPTGKMGGEAIVNMQSLLNPLRYKTWL